MSDAHFIMQTSHFLLIDATAVTLGQGHRKVIQYKLPDLYIVCAKYLRFSWNGFDVRGKGCCDGGRGVGRMGRRLFQKFVRAGRDGRPWRAAGMDFWNKRHGFLAPIVAEVRQSGPWEPAVDGQPWRAAGTDFWNKRHGFLSPIVAEVRQSGPWTAGRDGPPERTFETNGMDSWRRLLQKSVRAGRGSRPWTAGRDGPPGIDFWNKRHGFLAPIVAEVRQSGPWTAGRDGPPGIDFWNKRHGFLAPIVSKVCQIGPWWRAVDGWPWRAFISPTLTIPERRHSNTTCT